MKKHILNFKMLVATALLAIGLSACVSEELNETNPATGKIKEVTFTATIPGIINVGTRALTAGQECEILNNDLFIVLVQGSYKGTVNARNIVQSGTNGKTITFKASIPEGTYTKLHFVANSAGSQNSGNQNRWMVTNQKWITDASDTNYKGMPMYCLLENVAIDGSPISIDLKRILAKVDVKKAPAVSNFTLKRVTACNYATRANFMPQLIPGSQITTGYTNGLTYTSNAGADIVNEIYLAETKHATSYPSNNWQQSPCLIVAGRYESDTKDTYYRVDYIKTNASGNDEYMNLARNYSYDVSITEVNGRGYSTLQDAYNSAPTNMKATIVDWNTGMSNGTWNNAYAILTSEKKINFNPSGQATQTNVINIRSNTPSLSLTNFSSGTWTESPTGTWSNGHFTLVLSSGTDRGEYTEYTITATAGLNKQSARNITFDISGGLLAVTANLTQEAIFFESLFENGATEMEKKGIAMFGGTYPIFIKSNVDWEVAAVMIGNMSVPPSSFLNKTSGTAGSEKLDFTTLQMQNNYRGDNEYTIIFRNNNFGPLSGLTFYQRRSGMPAVENILAVDNTGQLNLDGRGWLVYFKWGSTIATAGGPVNSDFDASDVLWAPKGFNKAALIRSINQATNSTDKWACINFAPYVVGGLYEFNFPPFLLAEGLGDPCPLATKNGQAASNYRMPEHFNGVAANASQEGIEPGGTWIEAGNSPNGVLGYLSAAGTVDEQFYPYSGLRLVNGKMDTNKGYYWSSTAASIIGGYYVATGFGVSITYPESSPYYPSRPERYQGIPIRCVKD